MSNNSRNHDVPAETGSTMQHSMHNRVPVWCDCCSCEAEPYWTMAEAATAADKPSSSAGIKPARPEKA